MSILYYIALLAQEEAKMTEQLRSEAAKSLDRMQETQQRPRVACPTYTPGQGPVPHATAQVGQDATFQHMEWTIPASQHAHTVLKKTSKEQHLQFARAHLGSARVRTEATLPRIHEPKPPRNACKCSLIGFCMCRRWQIEAFTKRVSAFAKRACPTKSTNRLYLQRGMVVVQLEQLESSTRYWYHIGYTNLKTFVCAVIPLLPTADLIRRLEAEANGRYALDFKFPLHSRLGVHIWQHHFRYFDFSVPYKIRAYCLRDDECMLHESSFVPELLEVRNMYPTTEDTFWNDGDEKPPKRKSDGPSFAKGVGSRKRARLPRRAARPSAEREPSDNSSGGFGSDGSQASLDHKSESVGSGFDSDAPWLNDLNERLDSGSGTASSARSQVLVMIIAHYFTH